ncbi:hypothetical protein ACWD4B_04745 [Streptomyces sp. NPDC002536]
MTDVTLEPGTPVQLASSGTGVGGGDGTHQASVHPWTTAGGVAGELSEGMQVALSDLEHGHAALKSGTAGFASAATLSNILSGWQNRLGAVRDECRELDGNLKKAGANFGENEAQVKASFDALQSRSKIDDYAK